jgi:hypothetical protein
VLNTSSATATFDNSTRKVLIILMVFLDCPNVSTNCDCLMSSRKKKLSQRSDVVHSASNYLPRPLSHLLRN